MTRNTLAVLAAVLVAACGDPALTSIELTMARTSLVEGETEALEVTAKYDDDTTKDVTKDATFEVAGAGDLAAVSVEAGNVAAVIMGEATITATVDGKTASLPVTVTPAPIASLTVQSSGQFKRGQTAQLEVIATRASGHAGAIADGSPVTFSSSDEKVATVDEAGLVTILAGGPVTFTATAGGQTGKLERRVTCDYPHFASDIQLGRVMPNLSWPAKWPDGLDFELNVEDLYCDAKWDDVEVFAFILSAAWCNPCTQYARELAGEAEFLRRAGVQIIYVLGQDTEGAPCDTEYAYGHMDRIIRDTDGPIPGITVGDKDTRPTSAFVQNSSILFAWPAPWVVRRSDMKVIAWGGEKLPGSDDYAWTSRLPLLQMAKDPYANWTKGTVFVNECGASDDEAGEPNDAPDQATALTPGVHQGGICTDAPDLYQIDVAGEWTLELDFTNDTGDLDLFVWDAEKNKPYRTDDYQVIASTSVTDHEEITFTGPAVIAVTSFAHESAPYTLTLTEK